MGEFTGCPQNLCGKPCSRGSARLGQPWLGQARRGEARFGVGSTGEVMLTLWADQPR